MNYPPLKFKASGGPLDGEGWLLPKLNVTNVLRGGITFNLTRRDEDKKPYNINAKYKVEYDEQNKTYSATFMDNG